MSKKRKPNKERESMCGMRERGGMQRKESQIKREGGRMPNNRENKSERGGMKKKKAK